MARSEKIAPLEGLRAIAVAFVVVQHSMNFPKESTDYFLWWAPGAAGVRLFFVLSGFLITGILLRARALDDDRGTILRAFYVRRALRILPLASAALLIACLFNVQSVRDRWLWYAAYAINVRMAMTSDFVDVGLRHFWSLAVEEQFYLFWPLLVLWFPRRLLGRAMATLIAVAVVVRHGLLLAGLPLAAYVLMPARLDALAAGGVLAWSLEKGRRPSRWLWLAGVGAVAVGSALPAGAWANSWMEGGMVVVSLMVMDALTSMKRSAAFRVIAHPALVYVGGISYGVYVWHGLLPKLVRAIEGLTGVSLHLTYNLGWSRLVYLSCGAFVAAVTSWYLLERPLNNLKRYFPYVRLAQADAHQDGGARTWSRRDTDPAPRASRPAEGA